MFFAALMSRSYRVPQDGHVQCLVFRLSSASRCPHAEQVLLEGYQRSVTIRCRPYLAALYSSMARKVPHPQSEIRGERRFLPGLKSGVSTPQL